MAAGASGEAADTDGKVDRAGGGTMVDAPLVSRAAARLGLAELDGIEREAL